MVWTLAALREAVKSKKNGLASRIIALAKGKAPTGLEPATS